MNIEHLGHTYALTSDGNTVTVKAGRELVASDDATADGIAFVMGRLRAHAKKLERQCGRLERLDGTRHADYSALASDLGSGEHGLPGLCMAWVLSGGRLSRDGMIEATGHADSKWIIARNGHTFDAACESITDAMPEYLMDSLDYHEIREALSDVVGAYPSLKALAESAQEMRDSTDPDAITAQWDAHYTATA